VERLRWIQIGFVASLLFCGCNKYQHKKPDAKKGVVTGIVFCADTGKPARFATVALTSSPKADEKNEDGEALPATEITVTDIEGRFRMEAVEPGRYYAFATQEGYLDPALGVDPDKMRSLGSDRERHLYSIEAWKDHLTEVSVATRRTSEVSLEIERAAEIAGTVTFDDGSPAIGMRFEAFRKTEKKGWVPVGLPLMDTWTLRAQSDGHGRYSITNLQAGEYKVCALMPTETEAGAPRVCLGGVFRTKDAKTVKVASGETAGGVDLEIPVAGLHTVSGSVTALFDGHPVQHGTVRLLNADDREKARETELDDDGSFTFEYVPKDNYVLVVTGARDEPKDAAVRPYADKEIPLAVVNDLEGISLSLSTPAAPRAQAQPQ